MAPKADNSGSFYLQRIYVHIIPLEDPISNTQPHGNAEFSCFNPTHLIISKFHQGKWRLFCKPKNALPRFPLQGPNSKEFSCSLSRSRTFAQGKSRQLCISEAPGIPLLGPRLSCSVQAQDLSTGKG